MLLSTRALAGAIGAGAVAGALFSAPFALADPPPSPAPPAPPGCSAGDLAQVSAGVAASTSVYLFTHPDVNNFFTSLKGRPKSDIRADVQRYLDANPQVKSDLEGIRQPLTDLKNRCNS